VHLVTRGHFRLSEKMAVTPFDSPYPKTPRCTQTSWLCL